MSSVKPEDKDAFSRDINDVYDRFFSHNKNLIFILPEGELLSDFEATGYKPDDFLQVKIDPVTLKVVDKRKEGFGIQALRSKGQQGRAYLSLL